MDVVAETNKRKNTKKYPVWWHLMENVLLIELNIVRKCTEISEKYWYNFRDKSQYTQITSGVKVIETT